MAVTSVKIKHDGWTAAQDDKGKIDFTVVYIVEVDDRNDGPQIVASANDGTTRIPNLGLSYKVGNDEDPLAFCKRVSPRPVSGNLWEVTCTFGPRSDEEKDDDKPRDKDGRPVDKWENWYGSYSFYTIRTTVPAVLATYMGQMTTDEWGRTDLNEKEWPDGPDERDHSGFGNGVPVTNSANVPFDPPPDKDANRVGIRITRNHLTFPGVHLMFVDTLNRGRVVLKPDGPDKPGWIIFPQEGKLQSVTGDQHIFNGRLYWKVTYDVHLANWDANILDRGLHRNANQADDGNPASYSTKKSRAPVEAIVDSRGHPITEPVLFDGQGQPLKPDNADGIKAVYLRYELYPWYDWDWLKLGDLEPQLANNPEIDGRRE